MKNKKKIIIGVIAVVAAVVVLLGIYRAFGPKAAEGTKAYTVEVTGSEGATKQYSGKTDAEYLRGLMDELAAAGDFSYEGSDSEYGLMIETINGERADYALDGAYWAIYVNGEYGMYGADSQPVEDGETYSFVYESAQ